LGFFASETTKSGFLKRIQTYNSLKSTTRAKIDQTQIKIREIYAVGKLEMTDLWILLRRLVCRAETGEVRERDESTTPNQGFVNAFLVEKKYNGTDSFLLEKESICEMIGFVKAKLQEE